MTSNLPLSSELPASPALRSFLDSEASLLSSGPIGEKSRRLENRRRKHPASGRPGLWTGTREGLIATVIAVSASLLFGGAAGAWFAADGAGWFFQGLRIAGGTMAMAALVSVAGALLAGRNAIFWGVGMPLLIYVAGSFCAFITTGAEAAAFLFGAPVFCGLAILAGVMAAFAIDRGH